MWKALKQIFRSYFVAGLLVIVPLAVSAWIVAFIVRSTDRMLATSEWLPFAIPGVGLIVAVAVILVAGFIGRNVFGRYLFRSTGDLLVHVPVVGTIYSSTRQMLETLLGDTNKKFGRVVLVEYPHPGSKTIAFVTAETVPAEVGQFLNEPHLTVYVPTTPNPISGFYLYLPTAKTQQLNMTVEEAFKLVVSLGLVPPKYDPTTPLGAPRGN